MVEARLGTLVGQSSGYIEGLPAAVRRRITGLKGIQKDQSKLEAEFQHEVLELEKKYLAKFTPLYEKRSKIVNGAVEPTPEEVKAGEEEEDEDEEEGESEKAKPAEKADEEEEEKKGETPSGIPEFWLTAMKNTIFLSELITPQDEGPLRSLTDIRVEYLDKPGFRLVFEFGPNEFFENKTLTKTYHYHDEMGYGGEFVYDHAEGTVIEWKPLKDLTTRIEQKKQRNKSMFGTGEIGNLSNTALQIPSKLA
jgi:nucleosome assembly protein 1-like 1